MTITLYSARLELRPISGSDAAELHAHWNQIGVRRHLFDDRPVSPETVDSIIEAGARDFADHGYGLWVMRERGKSGPLIGVCGLRSAEPGPEVLYSLSESHWHRGLAFEATRTVLAHIFATTSLAVVHADIDADNEASVRLATRLGMRPTPGSPGPGGLLRFALRCADLARGG